jgi:hypothetical protein
MSRANRESLHPNEIERLAGATLDLEAKLNCLLDPRHELI